MVTYNTGNNQVTYYGYSTDTKPQGVEANSLFTCYDTNETYIYTGTEWIQNNCNYKDLGLVIDATNVAPGAMVFSNWYDNVQWVRNIVTLSQSDQQIDISTTRRDTSLIADYNGVIKGTINATGGSWVSYTFTPLNSSTAGALLGYSVKFSIKNSSASANTFARLRVQLMGV